MRERIGLSLIRDRISVYMDIAAIVRQLLAIEDITQSRLADEFEVEQATVSRWLSGSEPRGDTRDKIVALAKAKGIVPSGQSSKAKTANANRFLDVPIISWVSAGRLTESSEVPIDEGTQKIGVADLGDGDFFALRVSGDSMDRYSPDKSVIVVNRRDRMLQDGKPYI